MLRLTLARVLIAAALLIAAFGWTGDYRSCLRANATRAELTAYLDGVRDRAAQRARDPAIVGASIKATDAQAMRQITGTVRHLLPLRCAQPFPATP